MFGHLGNYFFNTLEKIRLRHPLHQWPSVFLLVYWFLKFYLSFGNEMFGHLCNLFFFNTLEKIRLRHPLHQWLLAPEGIDSDSVPL